MARKISCGMYPTFPDAIAHLKSRRFSPPDRATSPGAGRTTDRTTLSVDGITRMGYQKDRKAKDSRSRSSSSCLTAICYTERIPFHRYGWFGLVPGRTCKSSALFLRHLNQMILCKLDLRKRRTSRSNDLPSSGDTGSIHTLGSFPPLCRTHARWRLGGPVV